MNLNKFKLALTRVAAFVAARPHLPILACVCIDSDGDRLFLTGDDMTGRIEAIVDEPCPVFKAAIPLAHLRKILDKLKDPDITLSMIESPEPMLVLQTAHFDVKLPCRDTEFPPGPDPQYPMQASITCEYGTLMHDLRFAIKATEEGSTNYLGGVLFHLLKDETIRLVGTDGRRLHLGPLMHVADSYHDYMADAETEVVSLLPVSALISLSKLKLDASALIRLDFFENVIQWQIVDAGIRGAIRQLDSPYPDYEKIAPPLTNVFEFDSGVMAKRLEPLAVLAHEQDGRDMVIVSIRNEELRLMTLSAWSGSAETRMPCRQVSGVDNILFACNIDFLLDALDANENPDHLMTLSTELPTRPRNSEPIRFDYPGSERIAIIMPVRIPDEMMEELADR